MTDNLQKEADFFRAKDNLLQATRDLAEAIDTLRHNQGSARVWGNTYAISGLPEDRQQVRDCGQRCLDLLATIERIRGG